MSAVAWIRGSPGSLTSGDVGRSSGVADDANRVVVPDVTVEKDGTEWKIILDHDYIPRLRLSNTYKDLIAKGRLTKPESDYLR